MLLNFAKNYAILNLDCMTLLIEAGRETREDQSLINYCRRWNESGYIFNPRPRVFFSSLYFSRGEPDLASGASLAKLDRGYMSFTTGSPAVQIPPDFSVRKSPGSVETYMW